MKQESYRIGQKAEKDTSGARFYNLLCSAMELDENTEREEGDENFWKLIGILGVLAWNLSLQSGHPAELLDGMIEEFQLQELPDTFKVILLNMMNDRRDLYPEETTKMQECAFEEGFAVVVY